MGNLQAFFAENVEADITEEVKVSNRFKDADGKPIKWVIRALSEGENETIRKSATRRVEVRKGMFNAETSQDEYVLKLAVASVVFPNLKDEALQESYKVKGADNLLRKMLLPGEYAELVEQIQKLNGFEIGINDLRDEIKN